MLRERVPERSGALYSLYIDPPGGWGGGRAQPSCPAPLGTARHSPGAGSSGGDAHKSWRRRKDERPPGFQAGEIDGSLKSTHWFPNSGKKSITRNAKSQAHGPLLTHPNSTTAPRSSWELPAHATAPGTGWDGTSTCPALPLGRVLEGRRSRWERDRRKERGAGCQPSSWTRSHLSAPRKTRSKRGREETGEAAMVFELQ